MEYSITELSRFAGVSGRTLRYYDEIGLLRPSRVSEAGYRFYGKAEVDTLQQILFYRELGVELAPIKALLCAPEFDRVAALEEHLTALRERRGRLDLLIANAAKTIEHLKGEVVMNDREKFEGFKQKLVHENEVAYGAEIREKYGDEAVDASNAKLMNLTPEQYAEWQALGDEVLETLKAAKATGDPAGELAQQTCELHKRWLSFCGPAYSREYHRALGQMYAGDERFAAYYDAAGPGCAAFLRDAIEVFCG